MYVDLSIENHENFAVKNVRRIKLDGISFYIILSILRGDRVWKLFFRMTAYVIVRGL